MERPEEAAVLARLAEALHEERAEGPTLRTIIDQAPTVVPDAEHVSVTVRSRRHRWRTLDSTSPLAQCADALQYELREGPCVESSESGGWYRSGDVARDERWPRWGPRAAEMGVSSLVSVRLVAQGEPFGAVNMYSTSPGRFVDPDQIDRALLWATHVAAALSSARAVSNLESALASRHTIGMAQGIVMSRFGLDEEQSFQLLCRLSSHRNEKLRDVAGEIVRTRDLPKRDGVPDLPASYQEQH